MQAFLHECGFYEAIITIVESFCRCFSQPLYLTPLWATGYCPLSVKAWNTFFSLQAGTEHPPPQLLVHPLTCFSFPSNHFWVVPFLWQDKKKKKNLWIDGLKGRHNSNYTIWIFEQRYHCSWECTQSCCWVTHRTALKHFSSYCCRCEDEPETQNRMG